MKSVIINYGVGNLYSVSSALRKAGFEVSIAETPSSDIDLIVLPGVGSSKAVRRYLEEKGSMIVDVIKSGTNVLGICLGMQILYEYSTEYGYTKGLGILEGYVDRMPTKRKLPHIGWDPVYMLSTNNRCDMFSILHRDYVYFIHSYIVFPRRIADVCMVGHYDVIFPAVIHHKNIVGVQFHPEKSSIAGRKFFELLISWIKR